MAGKAENHHETRKKLFGLRLDQQLVRDLQHLAVEQDRYLNEIIEEAAKDLLKKYSGKSK